MGSRAPVVGKVGVSILVGDRSTGKERGVDGRPAVEVGGVRVVHQAVKLLGVGQPPVVMAQVVRGVPRLHPGQRILPGHADTAVHLGPHQVRGCVCDRAVPVVGEAVDAVTNGPADQLDEEGLLGDAVGHDQIVALDAAIGEVDAEELRVARLRGVDDKERAGGVLGVDEALPEARLPVGKIEIRRVDEGSEDRRVRAGVAAGIRPREVYQRVKLLDGRKPPVAESSVAHGVDRGDPGLRLAEGLLVGFDRGRERRVGAAHPGQLRDVVEHGLAIAAQGVAGLVAGVLRILAVEGLAGLRARDLRGVVVALVLACVDDRIVVRG